jgi:hypothetical protein
MFRAVTCCHIEKHTTLSLGTTILLIQTPLLPCYLCLHNASSNEKSVYGQSNGFQPTNDESKKRGRPNRNRVRPNYKDRDNLDILPHHRTNENSDFREHNYPFSDGLFGRLETILHNHA